MAVWYVVQSGPSTSESFGGTHVEVVQRPSFFSIPFRKQTPPLKPSNFEAPNKPREASHRAHLPSFNGQSVLLVLLPYPLRFLQSGRQVLLQLLLFFLFLERIPQLSIQSGKFLSFGISFHGRYFPETVLLDNLQRNTMDTKKNDKVNIFFFLLEIFSLFVIGTREGFKVFDSNTGRLCYERGEFSDQKSYCLFYAFVYIII